MERELAERRSRDRKKVIARVEVLAGDGAVSLVASVYNVSDTGMMLGTPAGYRFPGDFTVRLLGSDAAFPARVVWLRTGLAGLTFTASDDGAPPDL